jgi:hypothetical protein
VGLTGQRGEVNTLAEGGKVEDLVKAEIEDYIVAISSRTSLNRAMPPLSKR